MAASPSCPRCGVDCSPRAARCKACGFALIDDARRPRDARRRRGRVGSGLAWMLALGAAVGAMAIVLVILFTGGSSGSPVSPARVGQGPPAAVSAFEAELRLELRFGGHGAAGVSCPYRIEPRQLVRCELRYSDGIARAMLVRLTPDGELEAAVPYPATLRR